MLTLIVPGLIWTRQALADLTFSKKRISEDVKKTLQSAIAMQKIYALQSWTPVQRRWLDRLAKQLVHEVVIDQQQVSDAFRNDGGLKGLDRNLGGKLDLVLEALNENLWSAAG